MNSFKHSLGYFFLDLQKKIPARVSETMWRNLWRNVILSNISCRLVKSISKWKSTKKNLQDSEKTWEGSLKEFLEIFTSKTSEKVCGSLFKEFQTESEQKLQKESLMEFMIKSPVELLCKSQKGYRNDSQRTIGNSSWRKIRLLVSKKWTNAYMNWEARFVVKFSCLRNLYGVYHISRTTHSYTSPDFFPIIS